MNGLTPKQKAVLAALEQFHSSHGQAPTIRELGAAIGIRTLRGVTVHLDSLDRKCYIRREPSKPRGITILKRWDGTSWHPDQKAASLLTRVLHETTSPETHGLVSCPLLQDIRNYLEGRAA